MGVSHPHFLLVSHAVFYPSSPTIRKGKRHDPVVVRDMRLDARDHRAEGMTLFPLSIVVKGPGLPEASTTTGRKRGRTWWGRTKSSSASKRWPSVALPDARTG